MSGHGSGRSGARSILVAVMLLLSACTGEPAPGPSSRRVWLHGWAQGQRAPALRVRSLGAEDRKRAVADLLVSAESQYAQRQYGAAIEELESALAFDPENSEALALLTAARTRNLAIAPVRRQFEAADFPAALRLLYRTHTLDPVLQQEAMHAAWFNLAVVHARAAAYEEARADLAEAEAIIPMAAHCRVLQSALDGCEFFELGRCEAAEGIAFLDLQGQWLHNARLQKLGADEVGQGE